MAELLRVTGIRKSFPGVRALDGVDFWLGAGEVLALVGENGAGKSTLMKILSGVYTKDEGHIYVDGNEVELTSTKDAQELGINIIHQELGLAQHLTVAQNIWLGREPRTFGFINGRQLVRDTETLLAALGIDLDPRAIVETLPVGSQQMVEIARALSQRNRVLIMDEPTSALTESETERLFELIEALKAQGTGIVYISHRMEELRRLADRVTVLRDGAKVADLAGGDGLDVPAVIASMVGRQIDEQPPRAGGVVQRAETLLEVRGLSTRKLLRDVSFSVRAGEILGFAGLMGAGRTETARALIGADVRTSGSVLVRGVDVTPKTPSEAVKAGIGYLSEDRKKSGLLLGQSVAANIELSTLDRFSNFGFVNSKRADAAAQELFDRLRVRAPGLRATAGNLSGGNQQKLAIAKWLLRDLDILIFDEPTRGIDIGAKEEIYTVLNELAAQGKAIIVISSELPEVLRVSHRIIVMSGGEVTGELAAADANQHAIMALATKNIEANITTSPNAISAAALAQTQDSIGTGA